MRLRLVLALVVITAAVAAIASPDEVGELLGRPATTSSEMINLRATWGGSPTGNWAGNRVGGRRAPDPWP